MLFTEWVNPVDKHMGIILSRLETAAWPINVANYQESWHMHICSWLLSCKCIAYLKGHLDRNSSQNTRTHDDVIKWKHFPRYWPFVRGIHRSLVNSPHKWPVTWSFDVFFDLRLNKRLSKQSWGWWFETLSRPFWSHCNDGRLCQSVIGTLRSHRWNLRMDW